VLKYFGQGIVDPGKSHHAEKSVEEEEMPGLPDNGKLNDLVDAPKGEQGRSQSRNEKGKRSDKGKLQGGVAGKSVPGRGHGAEKIDPGNQKKHEQEQT